MRHVCFSFSRTLAALGVVSLFASGCSTGGSGGLMGSGDSAKGGGIPVGEGEGGADGVGAATGSGSNSGSKIAIDITNSQGGGNWTTVKKGVPQAIAAYQCTPNRFPKKLTCTGDSHETKTADDINWGEALQKSLWFMNLNKSGNGVWCTANQWRGNAHLEDAEILLDPTAPTGVNMSKKFIDAHRAALDPDGNGKVDLSGGFSDAGDYIKFGLTTAFAASMVGWSLFEFPDAYKNTGLEPETLALLRWFGDYFLRSTFIENGEVIAFAHQVGDITDHSCGWMPPEVRLTSFCPRKGYFATEEEPGSDVVAATAAALAMIGKDFFDRGVDIPYAERCLLHAMALYRFAKRYPDSVADTTDGLYQGEYTADKLAWAALWLAEATGDKTYLNDIVGSVTGWRDGAVWKQGYLSKYPGFASPMDGWTESWTYVWRSARSAVFLKFADILNRLYASRPTSSPEYVLAQRMKDIAQKDSLAWVDGPKSPGGFSLKVAVDWGSGRYNSAAQYLALTYAKMFPDDARAQDMKTWAKSQSAYLLGNNPLGKSYMMGFTEKYATQPHHAAGHASLYGEPDNPTENRHILYGALVNGPTDFKTDGHVDKRGNFAANEVTIDYNGAFIAALAANYQSMQSKQCPIDNFPPLEPRIDEFYTRDKVNVQGDCFTQVDITMINESIHPPRYDTNLTAQFYMNVTELIEAGVDPSKIQASILNDTGASYGQPTTLKGPTPCEENGDIWYIELGYLGSKFWGEMPKLTAPRNVLLQVGLPSQPGCPWDPSNDWSLQGVSSSESKKNKYVTVYSKGELIFGEEPECHPVQRIIVEPPPPVLL